MDKKKTLPRPRKSLQKTLKLKIKKDSKIVEHDPLKELLDEKLIDAAILECLKENDPQGAMEVLSIYIETLKRSKSK